MISNHDLLRFAEKLCLGQSETEWRCAISRAYYAAFHLAKDFLRALGFDAPRTETAHAFLWRRLQGCGHAELRLIGSDLNQLRGQRNRADYDLADQVTRRTAMSAFEIATNIFGVIESLDPDERAEIVEVIKSYERDVLREVTWRQRPR